MGVRKVKELTLLQRMRIADFEIKCTKTSMPRNLVPPSRIPNCKDANSLTKAVMLTVEAYGGQVERINRGFRIINSAKPGMKEKPIKIAMGGTNGTADVHASLIPKGGTYAASVKLEIKFGSDRMRPKQCEYEEKIEQAKGFYYKVTNFDDFAEWIIQFTGKQPEDLY